MPETFSASATRRRLRWPAAVAIGGALMMASGCADFAGEAAPNSWQPAPALSPEQPPNPVLPGQAGPSSSGDQGGRQGQNGTIPPPQGCQDFNPAVIATCLDAVSAVVALPGTDTDPIGLAAERTSGRIVRVHKGDPSQLQTTLQVDTSTADGGLTGLALSPTYTQDQLMFAYVTTATDNRVMLIAPGDTPKPILTGIPRGTTGNRGVLAVDHRGELLVATGDAGSPALATNPASLAGKVLRIDVDGQPAPDNPNPKSAIVASGLFEPGGVCSSTDGSQAWVTDRTPTEDVLYKLQLGRPLGVPAWTWPDQPGVAGCAAFSTSVMVATSTAGNVQSLALNKDGSFTGTPQISLQGPQGFGKLSGMDIIGDRGAMASTVNRDTGGTPVSSDDRVIIITSQPAGGGQD
ncbi:MAG TPA: PQQ-dependent sugar dehydrogenase [Pseudonocardiaceae bacterium]|nr:PQQ-dependent sugar dehydrogenase [Pseudonocardiaceae bacterium]